MTIQISFSSKFPAKTDALVLPVFEGDKTISADSDMPKSIQDFVTSAFKNAQGFSGKKGESLTTSLPGKSDYTLAVLVGCGKPADLTEQSAEIIGGHAYAALKKTKVKKACLSGTLFEAQKKKVKKTTPETALAHIGVGLRLASYRFEQYKTKTEKNKTLQSVTLSAAYASKAKKLWQAQNPAIDGVFLARDLVNEPPNTLYPDAYAKRIKKELTPLGIKVEILDDKKMKSLGMGAILAVGQGSARKPRMVIMQWNGAGKSGKKTQPIGFVGKGVTFDTGGISIKPAGGMDEMKMDMGGSAAVCGAMKAAALGKAKEHVVGIIGLAENMPSDNAYRPGDIIKSYAGKTVEVLNTDAEGRLVLADALTYIQKKYKPRMIVDLATLTGAMMVALGHEYCGTFANDDDLWSKMERASEETGEKLWRMPLDEVWKKEMESDVADLRNLGAVSRFAGACTAAGFLEHFIENDTPWAHMDIAGTAWRKSTKPTSPKYGTGFGVRVLNHLITKSKG